MGDASVASSQRCTPSNCFLVLFNTVLQVINNSVYANYLQHGEGELAGWPFQATRMLGCVLASPS